MSFHRQPDDFLLAERILVQPRMGRVVVHGEERAVEKKAMELLRFLAERQGDVATREEIFEAIWPSVAVTEHSLNRLISTLRKVLEEDAGSPRLLVTLRGVGYRLKASVGEAPIGDPPALGPPGAPSHHVPASRASEPPAPSSSEEPLPSDPPAKPSPSQPLASNSKSRLGGLFATLGLLLTLGWSALSWEEADTVRPPGSGEVRRPASEAGLLASALRAHDLARGKLAADHGLAEETIDLALEAAAELIRVGRPQEAESLLETISQRPELLQTSGGDALRRSNYHRQWADLLTYDSRAEEGLVHSEEALRLARQIAGEEGLQARILAALIHGETLAELGEQRGIELIEEHLELSKQQLGQGSELVARCLCSLGAAYFYQRRLLEAETYIEQCGVTTARIFGQESLEYARYEAFSGAVHWARDDQDAAREHGLAALNRVERLLGGRESQLAVDQMASLGTLSWMGGELLAAEIRLREALALSDRVLGEASRPSTIILQSLSIALRRAGRLDEAENVQRRNIKMRRRAGHHPVDLATAYQQLASILRERGDAEGAVAWAESALEIRQSRFGRRNLLTASSQMELGRCLLASDERERAIELFTEMVETREKMLPWDSPLVQESRDLLVEALRGAAS